MKYHSYILENGEQFDISEFQAQHLLRKGLIYDSGGNYYHLNNISFNDIKVSLKELTYDK